MVDRTYSGSFRRQRFIRADRVGHDILLKTGNGSFGCARRAMPIRFRGRRRAPSIEGIDDRSISVSVELRTCLVRSSPRGLVATRHEIAADHRPKAGNNRQLNVQCIEAMESLCSI